MQHETRSLTAGPKHHLFGYYDICPWNASESICSVWKATFRIICRCRKSAGVIGLVDAATGAFEPITETYAWNLQQGAMLNWNPLAADTEIIHNDRVDGEIVSVVYNIQSGSRRRPAPAC